MNLFGTMKIDGIFLKRGIFERFDPRSEGFLLEKAVFVASGVLIFSKMLIRADLPRENRKMILKYCNKEESEKMK